LRLQWGRGELPRKGAYPTVAGLFGWVLQWGRGELPRKGDVTQLIGTTPDPGFNGAAVSYRGKAIAHGTWSWPRTSFNGAAVSYRGKVDEAREAYCQRLASMGPR